MDPENEYTIIDKIKMARVLLDTLNNKNDMFNIIKFNSLIQKAELACYEVKINKIRSDAAMATMRDLEHDLDELLQEVKNNRN